MSPRTGQQLSSGRRVSAAQWASLGLVLAGIAALYLTHSLLRFRNFEARGYDLGIFDQAVRAYSQFQAPLSPIKGDDFHLLGDHFHPIIAALAPLYWIWDDPRMLNIALIALLVSAAVPVYLVVRGWFSHLVGVLAAAAMLLWWPFQAFINWDFHEIAFAVPTIGWVIWCIERERPWVAVILSSVLLLVREDMGATCAAIALVLALKRYWAPAAVLAVTGLVGLWLAVGVIIPYFAPAGEFGYWDYTALGSTASAGLLFLLTQPWNALPLLVDHPLKIALLLAHLLPLWFLPLLSPYTLIGLPMLLSRLFNDRLTVWGLVYHYDAALGLILLLAAFDTLRRIRHRRPRQTKSAAQYRPAVVLPVSMMALAAAGGVVLQLTVERDYQIFPLHWTYTAQNWQFSERAEAHQRTVQIIPDGACVEAADTMAPHLTSRAHVGLAGTLDDDRVEWLIIDEHAEELGGSDPLSPDQAFARAEQLGLAMLVADDRGLWVFSADAGDDAVCSAELE